MYSRNRNPGSSQPEAGGGCTHHEVVVLVAAFGQAVVAIQPLMSMGMYLSLYLDQVKFDGYDLSHQL